MTNTGGVKLAPYRPYLPEPVKLDVCGLLALSLTFSRPLLTPFARGVKVTLQSPHDRTQKQNCPALAHVERAGVSQAEKLTQCAEERHVNRRLVRDGVTKIIPTAQTGIRKPWLRVFVCLRSEPFKRCISQPHENYECVQRGRSGGNKVRHASFNAPGSEFDQVLFLALNYDLLLERAITSYDDVPFDHLDSYLPGKKKWSLIKPHGSANWGRQL